MAKSKDPSWYKPGAHGPYSIANTPKKEGIVSKIVKAVTKKK
jgi:hypothetical protein